MDVEGNHLAEGRGNLEEGRRAYQGNQEGGSQEGARLACLEVVRACRAYQGEGVWRMA